MKFRLNIFILSLSVWLLLTSENEKFSHLTIEDGLSQSSVKCLVQDSRGYIWIGTADGLNRYDGYGFQVMYSSNLNPYSINGNVILCIYEDPYDSTLWIGTQNAGLNIFNREFNNFYSFTHNPNSENTISSNQTLYRI